MTEIDELKKILEIHEKRICDLEKLFSKHDPSQIMNDEIIILKLIEKGFFDNYKTYGELVKELKTQAKFDKNVKYTQILVKFTAEDKLKRKISHKQWVYAKND